MLKGLVMLLAEHYIVLQGLTLFSVTGNLHVRNLEDDLIVRLKRRAVRHGRSAEAEHREILRQALSSEVEPAFDELAAKLREMTSKRKHTPAEELMCEGRAER